MRTLVTLDSPIRALVVSPDGSTVLTASGEGVGFLDLASGERRVTSLDDGVRRLVWGPDGPLAGTSSGEVWTVGRKVERLVEAIDEDISGMAVAGDGRIAVCGGDPFQVATFGRYGNEEWRGEPNKWPYCVRFSGDGTQLAMATWDGHLVVLDTRDLPDELGELDAEYAGGPIFDAQFLPDNDVLVAGARFVRVWDRAAGAFTRTHELAAEAFAIAVSPDGTRAVVSTNDQQLRVFGLPDLEEIGRLAAGREAAELRSSFPDYAEFCRVKGPATVRTLAFHPHGTRLFASTEDGRLLEVSRAELEAVAGSPRTTTAHGPSANGPVVNVPSTRELTAAREPKARVTNGPAASGPAASEPSANEPAAKPRAAKLAARTPPARKLPAKKLPAKKPPAKKPPAKKPAKKLPAKKPSARKAAGARRASKKPQTRVRPRR